MMQKSTFKCSISPVEAKDDVFCRNKNDPMTTTRDCAFAKSENIV